MDFFTAILINLTAFLSINLMSILKKIYSFKWPKKDLKNDGFWSQFLDLFKAPRKIKNDPISISNGVIFLSLFYLCNRFDFLQFWHSIIEVSCFDLRKFLLKVKP